MFDYFPCLNALQTVTRGWSTNSAIVVNSVNIYPIEVNRIWQNSLNKGPMDTHFLYQYATEICLPQSVLCHLCSHRRAPNVLSPLDFSITVLKLVKCGKYVILLFSHSFLVLHGLHLTVNWRKDLNTHVFLLRNWLCCI